MQEKNKKQKWSTPKLVVLVKGRPEDVLATCRGSGANAYELHASCSNKSCNACQLKTGGDM